MRPLKNRGATLKALQQPIDTSTAAGKCILDALCRTAGCHRKHAVRALRRHVVEKPTETRGPRERKRHYGVTIKDALTAIVGDVG